MRVSYDIIIFSLFHFDICLGKPFRGLSWSQPNLNKEVNLSCILKRKQFRALYGYNSDKRERILLAAMIIAEMTPTNICNLNSELKIEMVK